MKKDKLIEILKRIFKLKKITKKNGKRESNKKWDSLKHIELISEIEYEFKIKLLDNELSKINSLGNLENIIKKKFKIKK